ncbi:cation:proton antiporter [Ferrimonas balearica]|uniref:cation:proton antiporter domain-containing protein n=1 Tax=Ferrimonas balearica TaxID=44012 RepID=UPI001C9A1F42|nr:cation:proton antiporter [Ferrimonas balearica]MBY5992430.1 cation:proton antiporter [Ferrimonas balearica]
MYAELALLGVLVFLYAGVNGRMARGWVSGPMVFVAAGFLFGPAVMGWFQGDIEREELHLLTDLTLALILFTDAANADLTTLRRRFAIPARMLLLGLPGVMLLGFVLAAALFENLTLLEAGILGVMLAATDAALGKGVFANPAVPAPVREGLNTESGLNDGLCVPFLLLLLALESGSIEGLGDGQALALFAEELGIGLLVGLGGTALAGSFLRFCHRRGYLEELWLFIAVAALALALFATAQSLHGSGYIAAFSGGLLFGYLAKEHTHTAVIGAEVDGESLAMLTWFVFGAAVVGHLSPTPTVLLYALVSLTLVRMLPIYLCLAGSGESRYSRLFLGWFGPRGLASIVFTLIVLDSGLPGAPFIANVVACTVLLSLVLHGISANPLAARFRQQE